MIRAAPILALLAAAILGAAPAPTRAASFDVHDNRAAREIAEATELYIDGKMVALLRLDDHQRQVSLVVTVPGHRDEHGREEHSYVLCGTITVRNAQGIPEIHEVNASGMLHDPDGHRFEALGAEDFTMFYLSDPMDPDAADSVPQRSGLCRAPIS
jgi:hypothetical protein